MNSSRPNYRDLDAPTGWAIAAFIAAYLDYRALAGPALATQLMLFTGFVFSLWKMASAYDEFLEAGSGSATERATAASRHMILFGIIALAVCGAAVSLRQVPLFPSGQGRLVLTATFAGVLMISIGLRIRPFRSRQP